MADPVISPSVLTVQFESPEKQALFLTWFLEGGGQEAFEEYLSDEHAEIGIVDYDPKEECICIDIELESTDEEED